MKLVFGLLSEAHGFTLFSWVSLEIFRLEYIWKNVIFGGLNNSIFFYHIRDSIHDKPIFELVHHDYVACSNKWAATRGGGFGWSLLAHFTHAHICVSILNNTLSILKRLRASFPFLFRKYVICFWTEEQFMFQWCMIIKLPYKKYFIWQSNKHICLRDYQIRMGNSLKQS